MAYYSGDRIRAAKADIEITFGKRSNGKSYDDKLDSLRTYAETGNQFFYLRRRLEEIKGINLKSYFADMHQVLQTLFKGRFDGITEYDVEPRAGEFYLVGYDEEYNKHLFGVIGYYGALVQDEYKKTASFPNVTKLTFEEFLTRKPELDDEFTRLQNIISTVGRDRPGFRVRLIGNTVNMNSQILRGLNIDPRKLHQGEMKVYDYFGDDGARTRVAVEWTAPNEGVATSRFANFGRQKEAMIVNGEWEVDSYPLYTELPETKITDQFVLTDGVIKCYLYVDWTNRVGYCSNVREDTVGEYVVLSTDETILNRNTYNWACDYVPVQTVKRNIRSLVLNGQMRFKDYLTADDFFYITKGRL